MLLSIGYCPLDNGRNQEGTCYCPLGNKRHQEGTCQYPLDNKENQEETCYCPLGIFHWIIERTQTISLWHLAKQILWPRKLKILAKRVEEETRRKHLVKKQEEEIFCEGNLVIWQVDPTRWLTHFFIKPRALLCWLITISKNQILKRERKWRIGERKEGKGKAKKYKEHKVSVHEVW